MEKKTGKSLALVIETLELIEGELLYLGSTENKKIHRAEPKVGEKMTFGDELIHYAEELGNKVRLRLEDLIEDEKRGGKDRA